MRNVPPGYALYAIEKKCMQCNNINEIGATRCKYCNHIFYAAADGEEKREYNQRLEELKKKAKKGEADE